MTPTSTTVPAAQAPADSAAGRGRWISPKAWFLLGTIVFFAVYTEMAFDLEWRTQAGRIGPGYFPRIIGVLAMLVAAANLVLDLRSETHEVVELEDEVGEAAEHLGRHLGLMFVFVAICAVFISVLVTVGAIPATAVFLLVTLLLLDPAHKVRAVVLAVAVTAFMYLSFEVALNAGLPGGILDHF